MAKIYIDKQELTQRSIFPGGEMYVNISNINLAPRVTNIVAWLYSSDDIMRLVMAVNAIKEQVPYQFINLSIPYFPYARQDRVCEVGESFSVKAMAGLINSLGLSVITVLDPHSQAVCEYLDNCSPITQTEIVQATEIGDIIKGKRLTLIAPDAGAKHKVYETAQALGANAIYCEKRRDRVTGFIEYCKVPQHLHGGKYIVMDDICDGGRTFIELARKLEASGVRREQLYLYVTHGIFSNGFGDLGRYYRHIYCQHSFLTDDLIQGFVTVFTKGTR